MRRIKINTKEEKQVIDITEKLNEIIKDEGFDDGLCFITVLHTTAAVSGADLDPGTDLDMLDAFYGMVPDLDYRHPHNPEHVPDHILSTLVGPSANFPVENGELVLGRWQRVVLFEFDGPRERNLTINLIK